jgi:hypothetical protein
MRARVPNTGVVLLLVLALLVPAIAVAGCGGSDKPATENTPAAAATAADGRSADQIVKDSEAKMATLTSAAFAADFALKVQGDTSKMTDPTAKALLGQGVSFSAQGKSAQRPAATDVTMTVGIAGQNLEFGMKAVGEKAWLEYQGTWYKVDSTNAKALDEQAQNGAAPTEQLKSMGIDPSTWGTEYQLAGTEDLGGVQVYHVRAEADPQKLAESLAKAAADPGLSQKLGGAESELGPLGQGLGGSTQQVEELAKSLKSATVDFWIGVDDSYMYKAQFAASMDTSAQKDMQGLSGLSVNGTVTMSDFDQAFEVSPPAGAKPFKEFMNQLFGGMFGGSGGMMF